MGVSKCGFGALLGASLVAVSISFFSAPAISQEVRATFVNGCPTSLRPSSEPGLETLGVIGAAILTQVVGTAIDTGISALKKSVNPETSTAGGEFLQQGLYKYVPKEEGVTDKSSVRLNPKIGCLVVAIGEVGESNLEWQVPFEMDEVDKKDAVATLKRELGFSKFPSFLFEAVYVVSDDKTAVTWRPARLYVGEFLNSSFWAGKSRAIQLSFDLLKPGEDKAFYRQEFKFDNVAKGHNFKADKGFVGQPGAWGMLPPATKDKAAGGKEVAVALDPFTLVVQIAEVPKPYKLAQAFADAVGSQADALKEEASLLVDPAKRKAAAASAVASLQDSKEATLTTVKNYVDAWGEAKTSCAGIDGTDAAKSLLCKLAIDKAALANEKAAAACKTLNTNGCDALASLKLSAIASP